MNSTQATEWRVVRVVRLSRTLSSLWYEWTAVITHRIAGGFIETNLGSRGYDENNTNGAQSGDWISSWDLEARENFNVNWN